MAYVYGTGIVGAKTIYETHGFTESERPESRDRERQTDRHIEAADGRESWLVSLGHPYMLGTTSRIVTWLG